MAEDQPLTLGEVQRRRLLVAGARQALDSAGLGDCWSHSFIDSLDDGGPGLDLRPDAPPEAESVLEPYTAAGLVVQRRLWDYRLD
ncbi:MAG: hypothetical protein H7323_00985 [Frankiales bacterium]|nr:hypothetical protein [Frankiales bacterium]